MTPPTGRVHLIGRPAQDKGSDLCTMRAAHEIAVEEASKVHEFYLQQIPEFVTRMVMDGLLAHSLLGLVECRDCHTVTRRTGEPALSDSAGRMNCRVCDSPSEPVAFTVPGAARPTARQAADDASTGAERDTGGDGAERQETAAPPGPAPHAP